MLVEMKNIAEECLKHPSRISIWSEAKGKWVCPDEAAVLTFREALIQPAGAVVASTSAPRINPTFKLVFVTAAVGTVLFTVLCVSLHLATDGAPPAPMERFIQGMFDLVKVGFGAIVGLLGGKALDQPSKG